jgi:hypothetical protein
MNIFYNNILIIASRDAFGGVATHCACDHTPPL